jgi:hypothetical protein
MVVVIAIVAVITLLWMAGPYERSSEECSFCGRHRFRTTHLGFITEDRESETECSRWVAGIHPQHATHTWSSLSGSIKGWFGGTLCYDGLSNLLFIHRTRERMGEGAGRELLKEYHEVLRSGDQEALKAFEKRLLSEYE